MSMLERRVQILMDEARYARLEEAARERNESVAAVIRSLIDAMLPESERRRREAADWILEHAELDPMPVPEDPRDLRRELDEAYDRGIAD
ncbi:MAG: antitoxin [Thermoleophilia bacterium]|nr:antitoxin [Thermoleophilia bacterium]